MSRCQTSYHPVGGVRQCVFTEGHPGDHHFLSLSDSEVVLQGELPDNIDDIERWLDDSAPPSDPDWKEQIVAQLFDNLPEWVTGNGQRIMLTREQCIDLINYGTAGGKQ